MTCKLLVAIFTPFGTFCQKNGNGNTLDYSAMRAGPGSGGIRRTISDNALDYSAMGQALAAVVYGERSVTTP